MESSHSDDTCGFQWRDMDAVTTEFPLNLEKVQGTIATAKFNQNRMIFSQPSIYIDGWLYATSMTSVVCRL